MMNLASFIIGILFLSVSLVDLLWTTLWVDGGAGPLTDRLTSWGWSAMRKVAGGYPRVLSLAGPFLMGLTLLTWIVLLWAGWTFLFSSGENALHYVSDSRSITWAGRIYFVGYTMFTLGIGDIVPTNGGWQIATILTTANGMLFVTMSVSYLVSVLGAVTLKRSFASTVTGMGRKGAEFVRSGWNGDDFEGFEGLLPTLSTELQRLTYQHQAYPILHYYYSREDGHSSAIGTAILDEALTVLRCGVPEEYQPEPVCLIQARASTRSYMDTLHSSFVPVAEDLPAAPDLDVLRAAGIPTVSDEEFASELENLIERRQRLLRMVKEDAREWPQ